MTKGGVYSIYKLSFFCGTQEWMGWSYTTTQLFVGLFGMMEHTSILIASAHNVVCVLFEKRCREMVIIIF